MAIEKSLIQPEPVISAIINGDNTGVLKINGDEHPYEAPDVNELRQALMKRVIGEAATLGRPVRVTSMDDTGVSYLVVSPAGDVEEEQPTTVPEDASAIIERIPSAPAATITMAAATTATTVVREPALTAAPAAATRRSIREAGSFLAAPSAVEPATQGIRGVLNSLGFSLGPSEDELSEREDIRLASKHFAGTRTIAVVNQKGGSNKTPTVAGLAAVFGRNGGSVVGWDNNPTTGTLGWRTEQGDHARSALDVIAAADALLSPTAQSADINAFVHHQSTDKYDVLRSDADVDGTHEVTAEEVDVLHRVVSKYYRLILMDSGNNHRSAEWNRMIDHADQLVVPTTNEEDRVEAALLTLQGLDLKAERSAGLASNAVVIVSERQRGEARLSQETAEKFRPYVRDVVVVPFDEALKSGQIRFGALQPATRRAWLRAAAAVARGL
ncbi:AAA family ATPase (plasmid) [Pseudarthrobacter psychrotolerans]|uniref:AAA family ATPase n=1 Tax=Pseudarthrobacter psychrotolerans TaxID=2697569 RepID=A0A6P1NV52_9MICC|nr:AAA family ATPase [Pseudarthrobacter psychrotolerans]QHK22627.1 AAA family ATPase [Pseudarthrobacter psychrotolerans]